MMRGKRLGLSIGAAVVVVAVVAVVSLSAAWRASRRAEAASDDVRAGRDVPRLDGAFIRYSPEFARAAGIAIESADAAELSPLLTVTGTAAFDPELTAAVGTRIAGRVRRIKRYEGAEVRAGDVLAEIESAELGQAQSARLTARAHADEAAANEAREVKLAEARISSEREAEQARAAAAAARAELVAAEQRVRALGGGSGEAIGVLLLRSPIDGKVVDRSISVGQSVDPATTAFRVADLARLWIELAVFERDLPFVHEGDAVEISPQTDGATVLAGTIAHVGDVVDLDTRSADVRVVVGNPGGRLRAGQSVIARIARIRESDGGSAGGPRTIVVPREAVVSVDGRATVFVAHDETSVEVRSVALGSRDASRVEIVSGLAPRERIVVAGVFALKSELFR
jgi:cobalt-zinc-cadmium efflux system membrane fusion protein